MDNVVKVRRSFLNEIRGFCNLFASMCDGCFKSPCNCQMIDVIHRAKSLILMLDNVRDAEEERYYIANPHEEFLARIVSAIRQGGGRPVKSSEIRIDGECRQRKARALKTLVERGTILRIASDGEPIYVINDHIKTNNNNKTRGERHGV